MALVTPVFLDTTVFLEGLIDMGAASEKARAIIEMIAEGRIRHGQTAWHCCLEFYAVSTRLPEEFRLAPEDAERVIAEGILKNFEVHDLPDKARRPFLTAAGRERVIGGRVYDAHITETALLSGARTVITGNVRHFKGLSGHGILVLTTGEVNLRG
jgi:predicted nucleic acid-binding protein